MSSVPRILQTRRGPIRLPVFVPVTTFGDRYPLDRLIRPYLPRLAHAMLVSYPFAKGVKPEEIRLPLFVDSGGFASLFETSTIVEDSGLGVLHTRQDDVEDTVHPRHVLDLQEGLADVAFPLDFPIPPGMDEAQARRRFDLTIANAVWALDNRRRRDLLLFGVVQAWDADTARESARTLARRQFDGFAIGGMVPRARDLALVRAMVEAVRGEIGDRPLHVFGLGKPDVVRQLFEWGVDSVDSSSYVKLAADGKVWGDDQFHLPDATVPERLNLALCNLATAAGRSLPLAASRLVFRSSALGLAG